MPNYCENKLNLIGPTDKIIEYAKSIEEDNVFFELVIPNPNPDDWYNFNKENWGTKWDICDFSQPQVETIDNDKSKLTIYFTTAWSPPIGIYEELHEMGFDVEAGFFEPGMGFYGRFTDGTTYSAEYGSPTEISDEFVKYFDLQDWVEDEILYLEEVE